jgi:hypothetical protein
MLNNDKLFRLDFNRNDAPELLFLRVVPGGSNNHVKPLFQHTVDQEHRAPPPPVRYLPNEGVWRLGDNNQQVMNIFEVVHTWRVPAPPRGGWPLKHIGTARIRPHANYVCNAG